MTVYWILFAWGARIRSFSYLWFSVRPSSSINVEYFTTRRLSTKSPRLIVLELKATPCKQKIDCTWLCVYQPALLGIRLEIKCHYTRCNRGFYCRSYCLLNMFRASLCPSSGAQEYYTVVAACGISCCGFSSSWSGVELSVMRPVCRMLQQ